MSQHKFTAHSTALEVIEGHNLSGYEIIVTGGASGIGTETVRAFAKAGARVVIGARDLVKAEEIAKEIRQSTGNENIEIEKIELDSLESVKEFVKRYLAKNRPLHILVNNAGVMGCPLNYTVDGFESQFGTNHMGHFALTLGLLPLLKETAAKSGRKSRVVIVSSLAHCLGDIDFDDINFKKREYEPMVSYGQSKTANALFAVALNKLYGDQGILANSLMPGAILTNLQKHMSEEQKTNLFTPELVTKFKTIEQGASTTVWVAVASELDNVGGKYFENCALSESSNSKEEMYGMLNGHLPFIYNEENSMRLWKISMDWLENPPK